MSDVKVTNEEQASDSEVTKPEAKKATAIAIAERCQRHKLTVTSLAKHSDMDATAMAIAKQRCQHKSIVKSVARHFDIDEADIIEIRKPKAYFDAIMELLVSKLVEESLPTETE